MLKIMLEWSAGAYLGSDCMLRSMKGGSTTLGRRVPYSILNRLLPNKISIRMPCQTAGLLQGSYAFPGRSSLCSSATQRASDCPRSKTVTRPSKLQLCICQLFPASLPPNINNLCYYVFTSSPLYLSHRAQACQMYLPLQFGFMYHFGFMQAWKVGLQGCECFGCGLAPLPMYALAHQVYALFSSLLVFFPGFASLSSIHRI